MAINAIQGTSLVTGQPRSEREKFIGDFNAAIDTARAKLDESQQVGKTAREELTEWLQKTPEQHMRDAILKELGLTEEDVAAMSPEKRAALEDVIAERIKEKLAEATGTTPKQQQEQLLALLSQALPGMENKSIATREPEGVTDEKKNTLF